MILLGLGSNLPSSYGDRFENIEIAISDLKKKGVNLIKRSSFYESFSYPNKKNPKFINIVIEVSTHLNPENLAAILIEIEEKLERRRNKKNDPRTCDIDIIDYNSKIITFKHKNSDFIIPHKDLILRNFVLFPLQEILPQWKHPKTKEPIAILIEKLSSEDKKSILKINKS